MISVRRNRAITFIAALECLRDASNELIEHLKLDVGPDESEEEYEEFNRQHGSIEDVLTAFDDALEFLPDEREGYIVEAELENPNTLTVQFKERKE